MNTPSHNFRTPECTFGKNNWSTLAKFWQVIAWSDEVTDAPLGRKLLDVAVVLFRDENGKVIYRKVGVIDPEKVKNAILNTLTTYHTAPARAARSRK